MSWSSLTKAVAPQLSLCSSVPQAWLLNVWVGLNGVCSTRKPERKAGRRGSVVRNGFCASAGQLDRKRAGRIRDASVSVRDSKTTS